MHAAELLDTRSDQRCALVGVGDVGLQQDGATAGRLDELGRLLQPVDPAGTEDDVGSRLGEGQRAGDPQAGGGSGDDGDLAVEAEAV